MRAMRIPGMTLAVTDRDHIIQLHAQGVANIDSGLPVAPTTLFEIGSIGKPFTVIPILQLREAGQLELGAPVNRYLPWFEVDSRFSPITVHHLLTHTAGLPRGTDIAPHGLYESWALRQHKPVSEPGEHFWYSNVGYKTLGFILERLCGEPLHSLIQSRVLAPLGMTSTQPAITPGMRAHTATGYTSIYDDRPEHVTHELAPSVWAEYATGDGAQASNVVDMTAYLRMLLNRGRGPSGALISEVSYDMMTTGGYWTGGDYYGYGIATYDVDGRHYIGHGGGNAGFRSALVVDMQEGLGVVLLANRMGETDPLVEVAQQALTAVSRESRGLPLPALVTPDRTSVANASDYEGSYGSDERQFQLIPASGGLRMRYAGREITLERRTADSFFVPHPDFELGLLEFARKDGVVVEAFYLGHWYPNQRYKGPDRFEIPHEWQAFIGHYRTRSPEISNFRIVVRKDRLTFIHPWGITLPLVPVKDALFRIGAEPHSPETLRFDAIAAGHALIADYSGCPFYRTFTS